VTLGIG